MVSRSTWDSLFFIVVVLIKVCDAWLRISDKKFLLVHQKDGFFPIALVSVWQHYSVKELAKYFHFTSSSAEKKSIETPRMRWTEQYRNDEKVTSFLFTGSLPTCTIFLVGRWRIRCVWVMGISICICFVFIFGFSAQRISIVNSLSVTIADLTVANSK